MTFYLGATGASLDATSVPLPSGLQEGDVLLLGGYGADAFTVTDARFSKILDTNPPTNPGVASYWQAVYDGDDSDVTYTGDGGPFSRLGVLLTAWRTSTPPTGMAYTQGTGDSGAMPTVDRTRLAVACTFLGNTVTSGFVDLPSGWVNRVSDADLGTIGSPAISIRFWSYEGEGYGDSPGGTFTASGGDPRWTVVVLRMNPLPSAIPPLRQTHRSDGLGLIPSAKRILPPPRSIQGSQRRHGPGTHL